MIYCDTSLLVTALTREQRSDAAAAWLTRQASDRLATSGWTDVEFASALAMKVRTGQIDSTARSHVMGLWRTIRTSSFVVLSIDQAHFTSATQLLERPDLGLRAGDALHVAIAMARGLSIATLDKRMAEAAIMLGLTVEPVLSPT